MSCPFCYPFFLFLQIKKGGRNDEAIPQDELFQKQGQRGHRVPQCDGGLFHLSGGVSGQRSGTACGGLRFFQENYRAEDSRDAKEARRVLPLEHISALSAPAGEEENGSDDLRSLENAQRILNAAALTPVQKRRFLMYHYKGLTLREIAAYEDVGYSKIVKSIVQAEKKIYKILQQMPK